MRIGYARVSTEEQNEDAQLDALNAAYCEKLYIEKCSGKSKNRPQLERMIDSLRKNDVIAEV